MFTKAEEQSREKKIAFENAPVNLKKDMKHLFLKVREKGNGYVFLNPVIIDGCFQCKGLM